jgi:formate dehydrogenase iron-sulfur subunit
MDKCTFCADGPEADVIDDDQRLSGRDRAAEDKGPLCAGMCATKALLAGNEDVIADVYQQRVFLRGYGIKAWGWTKAYVKTLSAIYL